MLSLCLVAISAFLHCTASGSTLQPYDLAVNYRATHETIDASKHPHLPILHLPQGHNEKTNTLPIFSWRLPIPPANQPFNISLHSFDIEILSPKEHKVLWSSLVEATRPKVDLNSLFIDSPSQDEFRKVLWQQTTGSHIYLPFPQLTHSHATKKQKQVVSKLVSFRVRCHYSTGFSSEWSPQGRFILSSPSSPQSPFDNAMWIGAPKAGQVSGAPFIKKTFSLVANSGNVTDCMVTIAGLSLFALFLFCFVWRFPSFYSLPLFLCVC